MTPEAITQAIKQFDGDLTAAAAFLGTDRPTLVERMEQLAKDRAFLRQIQEGDVGTQGIPEEAVKARRLAAATDQVDAALEAIKEREKEQAKKDVDSRVSTLSPKERLFLINYLAGESQTSAARIAGYANPDKQGSRLANTPKMKAAIDEVLTAQEMPKRKVVARLSQQAEAAYAPYLKSERGRGYSDLDALIADGLGHLIKGFKETQWGQAVEFYDAQTALVHMGRYHGLFTDNVNQSGEVTHNVKEPVMEKLTRLADLLGRAKQRRPGAAAEKDGE